MKRISFKGTKLKLVHVLFHMGESIDFLYLDELRIVLFNLFIFTALRISPLIAWV